MEKMLEYRGYAALIELLLRRKHISLRYIRVWSLRNSRRPESTGRRSTGRRGRVEQALLGLRLRTENKTKNDEHGETINHSGADRPVCQLPSNNIQRIPDLVPRARELAPARRCRHGRERRREPWTPRAPLESRMAWRFRQDVGDVYGVAAPAETRGIIKSRSTTRGGSIGRYGDRWKGAHGPGRGVVGRRGGGRLRGGRDAEAFEIRGRCRVGFTRRNRCCGLPFRTWTMCVNKVALFVLELVNSFHSLCCTASVDRCPRTCRLRS